MPVGGGLRWLSWVLGVAVVGFVAVMLLWDQPEVDPTTGCPVGRGHTAVTLTVLLDATDPFGAAQQRAIINRIWDEVDALAVYDRIRVFAVSPGPSAPSFNLCKPGRQLQDSPVERRLREAQFKEFLDGGLREVQRTAPSSPIIASLGWVAVNRERDESAMRILLVSDLMENSEVISHYDEEWPSFYARNRERIHDQCPMLEGIQIDVLLATRPLEATQGNVLIEWWIEYLSACGGVVGLVQKITGVN